MKRASRWRFVLDGKGEGQVEHTNHGSLAGGASTRRGQVLEAGRTLWPTRWGQGERLAEDYLRLRDRRAIGVLSLSAFVLILVLILLTFFAVVVGGVELVIWW